MLSLSDFKEKQLLFIQAERGVENKLRFWNDNLRFMKDGKVCDQISCYKLFAVFIIGDISITSVLLKKAKSYGISLHFLDDRLNAYASLNAQTEGHYLLRQRQYDFRDDVNFAKHIVFNKIRNQSALLKEIRAELLFDEKKVLKSVYSCCDEQELLGVEGNASKQFFDQYFKHFGWNRRLPRAKLDMHNALLDIGYHYLFNFVDGLLRLYGFDTYKGIYHKLFFQRRSLACDIMEPFRCIIDKQIRKSINLKQFKEADFFVKRGQYFLRYDKNIEYGRVFADVLIAHQKEIYQYVRDFYRCLQNQSADYPTFEIHIRG